MSERRLRMVACGVIDVNDSDSCAAVDGASSGAKADARLAGGCAFSGFTKWPSAVLMYPAGGMMQAKVRAGKEGENVVAAVRLCSCQVLKPKLNIDVGCTDDIYVCSVRSF